MITSNETYQRFYTALKRYSDAYGRGFQAFLDADGCTSASYAGMILKKTRTASFDVQKAIAKACGYEYEDFLNYGQETLPEKPTKTEQPDQTESEIIKAMVGLFKNKTHAERIINNLLEFDKLGVVAFVDLSGRIETQLVTIQQERLESSPPEEGKRSTA